MLLHCHLHDYTRARLRDAAAGAGFAAIVSRDMALDDGGDGRSGGSGAWRHDVGCFAVGWVNVCLLLSH